MPECPICRRSYDGRFQVFVPPHSEAFDSVACAQRAAEVRGRDEAAPVQVTPAPVILPTIEVVRPRSGTEVAYTASRRGVAALGSLVVAPGQAALATGVGLLAAGTAASVYLWATWPSAHPSPVAAGVPQTVPTTGPPAGSTPPSTIGPPPAATRPSTTGPAPATTEPSAAEPSLASSQPSATGPARIPPATQATHVVSKVPKSAAEAQYGTYRPPFASINASR
jgi:hypothetical protein